MNKTQKCENLIKSWVKLSAMVKNSRITKGLVYNEAIIMLLIYEKYQKDGEGVISIKEITKETNIISSVSIYFRKSPSQIRWLKVDKSSLFT